MTYIHVLVLNLCYIIYAKLLATNYIFQLDKKLPIITHSKNTGFNLKLTKQNKT